MSLQHLFAGKSAQFFRPNPKRRLTGTSLTTVVTEISRERVGRFNDHRIRERRQVDGCTFFVTYACFKLRSEPPFLHQSPLSDERYAYVLVVEAPEAIAVFGRNAQAVSDALEPYVLPWSYEHLGGVFIDDSSTFERISLRTMSLGGNVVRRRSLEADDLAVSMSTAGVHRSIPNNFRTRGNAGTHTITPRNARISRRDGRTGIDDLLRWVLLTGLELTTAAAKYPATFLAEFCRTVALSDLPSTTIPNAILFDLSELRAAWEQSPGEYEFVLCSSPRSSDGRTLNEAQVVGLFDTAENVFDIMDESITFAPRDGKVHIVGSLRINKETFSVRGDLLERILIKNGGTEKRLSTYANNNSSFLITFTNPEFAYSERQLFRDGGLLGSIEGLLQLFEPWHELSDVTDEKDVRVREFGHHGIFRFVEDRAIPADATLICDDLGDEWADYVALQTTTSPPRLSFIHCKHGDASSSASALQTPVGQAIKNLSRMFRPIEDFTTRVDTKWSDLYSGRIRRIRRGATPAHAKTVFRELIANPNTQREVILVLSGVSLATLGEELNGLKLGKGRPHVTQLLWLLANFLGSCREHGVSLRIMCQP